MGRLINKVTLSTGSHKIDTQLDGREAVILSSTSPLVLQAPAPFPHLVSTLAKFAEKMSSSKKVLVTGATGPQGRGVVPYRLAAGNQVYAYVCNLTVAAG
jgi:hypothetical protein